MCGYQIIRYAHNMEHPKYGSLTCGCVCAGKMEGNIEEARRREAEFKNIQARRVNFFKRKWKHSQKGNDYLKIDDHVIVIYKLNVDKAWKYSMIMNSLRVNMLLEKEQWQRLLSSWKS